MQQLPSSESFLSQREQAFFQTLKLPKRRKEWLGGRFALKQLVAAEVGVSLDRVEALPQETSGKPQLFIRGEKSVLPFSITHSNGYAAAAITTEAHYIGIDLEKIASRIDAWKKDFFHPTELVCGQGDDFLTSLWTQKEAVVKLLGVGLTLKSFDVRCIGGRVELYGHALQVYQQIGSPVITLTTKPVLDGFILSVAFGN